MAYAALSTVQTIATGQPFLAATLQQANDNGEFLIDPPACSILETSPVSLANDTFTALNADEENFDNDSMHSTTSNTSRITIQTAGRYLFSATIEYAAGGNRTITELRLNGSTVILGDARPNDATNGVRVQVVRTQVCSAGDYIETRAYQNSGGAINVKLNEFLAIFITR